MRLLNITPLVMAVCQAGVTLNPQGHLLTWLSVNTLVFIIDSLDCDSPTPKAAIGLPSLCPVGFFFSSRFLFLRTTEYFTLILSDGLRPCISNRLPGDDSDPDLWTKD